MFPTIIVQRRLTDLGEHLIELGDQVHVAITDAVSETVARLARDAVSHLLIRRISARPVRSSVYEATDDFDPWNDVEQEYLPRTASGFSGVRHLVPRPTIAAVTAGLGMAGLWLRFGGAIPNAILVGLGAMFFAGRGKTTATVVDFLALTGCITAAGKALSAGQPAESESGW